MSGRVATLSPNRRSYPIARFLLGLGLVAVVSLAWAAEPPGSHPAGSQARDDQSPRPPSDNRSVVTQKYQIPNKDRAIFEGFRDPKTGKRTGGIVDLEPIASETANQQEFAAWHEVLAHASQFTAAELEEHARRDATQDELIGPPRCRNQYRLELLRFDGKLTRIRRLPATRLMRESGGPTELFEALLVPLDEPPTKLVSLMFTELPEALAAVRQTNVAEWMTVDRWGIATGYFFKVVCDAPGEAAIPVLIGKSVRVLNEPPVGPDAKHPTALDKNLRVFRAIRNDAPIATGDENWEEVVAWNRVLLHARRFSPEQLEENARTDLNFFDLFNDGKWVDKDGRTRFDGSRDYKLDLVRFEGQLISLKKMAPSRDLSEAGIESAYEGWLVPKNEPTGNPVCIVFTDPLEGVEPTGRVNKWVSFAGYAFKLYQYESGEKDSNDPSKHKWKRAPLLLGRAAIARPDADGISSVSWRSFVTIATGVLIVLLGSALGLNWWFRRGDRAVRSEVEANRLRNPFSEHA